jgi:hypothetical protein
MRALRERQRSIPGIWGGMHGDGGRGRGGKMKEDLLFKI